MKHRASILLILLMGLWLTSVQASHSFGELDLCTLYPEVMPPGLDARLLPQPSSRGARVMQTYCSQCHELPGPGRHTASEWPAVLERMTVLMDATSRFSGLMGHVQTPAAEEGRTLRDYLVQHALKPLAEKPVGLGAKAFINQCSSCHALPDPAQYNAGEWPAVIKRMQRNMAIMKHKPASHEVILQVQTFLQQTSTETSKGLALNSKAKGALEKQRPEFYAAGLAKLDSWLALGPFFGLAVVGFIRWGRGR